jgi:hypothetical protein
VGGVGSRQGQVFWASATTNPPALPLSHNRGTATKRGTQRGKDRHTETFVAPVAEPRSGTAETKVARVHCPPVVPSDMPHSWSSALIVEQFS